MGRYEVSQQDALTERGELTGINRNQAISQAERIGCESVVAA
jgi:hypothetical protein